MLASVDRVAGSVTTMEHHVLNIHGADKYATATEIAARDGRVLMFLDTKAGVDQFTRHLRASGVRAAALHSGKSQPQRTHTLGQFKDGEVTVLVATNVAARGIHIDALDLVVNVDPPADAKDYLHRGGRTARAGESGKVVTLVTPNQRREVNRMMSEAGIRPTVTQVRSGEAQLTAITGAKRPPTGTKSATGNAPFRGLGTRPGRPRRSPARPPRPARRRRPARRPGCARAADRDQRRPTPADGPGSGAGRETEAGECCRTGGGVGVSGEEERAGRLVGAPRRVERRRGGELTGQVAVQERLRPVELGGGDRVAGDHGSGRRRPGPGPPGGR